MKKRRIVETDVPGVHMPMLVDEKKPAKKKKKAKAAKWREQ